jgi:high-affinity nickel permease
LVIVTSLLILGFFIGLRHAIEADHLAAIATLTIEEHSLVGAMKQGMAWGLGHGLALFLFGSIVIQIDGVIPEQLAQTLEVLVGVMLIFLGFSAMRRMSGKYFIQEYRPHEVGVSINQHLVMSRTFPVRGLLVGSMHGMAGSAALILLTINTMNSAKFGMIYIAVFGIGSILGMVLISLTIFYSLRKSNMFIYCLPHTQTIISLFSIMVGAYIVIDGFSHIA